MESLPFQFFMRNSRWNCILGLILPAKQPISRTCSINLHDFSSYAPHQWHFHLYYSAMTVPLEVRILFMKCTSIALQCHFQDPLNTHSNERAGRVVFLFPANFLLHCSLWHLNLKEEMTDFFSFLSEYKVNQLIA